MLKIIETTQETAHQIMQKDHDLLNSLTGDVILHLYDWKNPSITYGYFIRPDKYFNIDALKNEGIDLARRPTGGGIVFHLWDLAFSLLVPEGHPYCYGEPLKNYSWVNALVLKATQELFLLEESLQKENFLINQELNDFCMAHPTHYDVVFGDKKIAGAAQRKKKNGFLHQGTIFIKKPDLDLLKKILVIDDKDKQSLYQNSFYLTEKQDKYEELKRKLKLLLVKHLQKTDL